MLRFGRIGMTRPESFPKLFEVFTQETTTSFRGRERRSEKKSIGFVRCILSVALPEEIERFSQLGVAVSHRIIQRGSPIAAENDFFVLTKNGKKTRAFRVQAAHNKGEMDIDTLYYCEERSDVLHELHD